MCLRCRQRFSSMKFVRSFFLFFLLLFPSFSFILTFYVGIWIFFYRRLFIAPLVINIVSFSRELANTFHRLRHTFSYFAFYLWPLNYLNRMSVGWLMLLYFFFFWFFLFCLLILCMQWLAILVHSFIVHSHQIECAETKEMREKKILLFFFFLLNCFIFRNCCFSCSLNFVVLINIISLLIVCHKRQVATVCEHSWFKDDCGIHASECFKGKFMCLFIENVKHL